MRSYPLASFVARLMLSVAAPTLLACAPAPDPAGSQRPSGPPCATARFAVGRFSVQCGQLVDAEGRITFLHGVNARVAGIFDVTFDDGRKALEPIPPFAASDAMRMRAMGFNALRLPINWSGLEPQQDKGFDEAYLDRVAASVDVAARAGMRVLIDFHQDAYSKEIGEDGAPLWAIKPPPTKLLSGPLIDLGSRRSSGQVLDAFATFFGDSSDGATLRTRFTRAVAHVTNRFMGNDDVLGIEILNEPIANHAAELYRLYDEVIAAIRTVDRGRLALFEPDTSRNLFDHAPTASRVPWSGTAYAPHIYTLTFTGSDAQKSMMTKDTLDPSNAAARGEAESWSAPLVITEFGYGPADIQADNYLAWQAELQDQYQASAFFWVWKEQSQASWGLFQHDDVAGTWTERAHVRKALSRVMPEAIAGWPASFGHDRAAKRFDLKFTGDPTIKAPNRIFVPAPEDFASAFDVTCDGAAVSVTRDTTTGILEVPCNGAGSHELVVIGR